ncbi:hypothetical protein FHG87_014150 [Trinorchestia longiramus]|nr:hypothetical protein FHG87_014150 [Trinorchestia longiramus]
MRQLSELHRRIKGQYTSREEHKNPAFLHVFSNESSPQSILKDNPLQPIQETSLYLLTECSHVSSTCSRERERVRDSSLQKEGS